MLPLIVRTLEGETVERPPVWLMRQAGRYMSEYRALKEKYSFLQLCKSPELAVEVTLQPITAFNPDAAIVFADILLPFEGMGIEIDFNPGPVIKNPIRTPSDIERLSTENTSEELFYVYETLKILKKELPKETGLLGFAGAPWTLACYLIDQGIYKHYHGTQVFAQKHPEAMHKLLDLLSDVVSAYLIRQLEAGADAVQLFDSWGGILSKEDYSTFSLPYIKKIFNRIQEAGGKTILYVNGSSHLLPQLSDSGANALSVDWRTEPLTARESGLCIQGNIDPTLLFSSEKVVRQSVRKLIQSWPDKKGLVVNLGHGILPGTPVENVRAFFEEVKEGW